MWKLRTRNQGNTHFFELIPATMDQTEFIIYVVISIILIGVCCFFCFWLQWFIIFGLVIIVFVAMLFSYMYLYRDKR